MKANKPIITVSQLNTYTKAILDQDIVLKNVFVTGEISNFTNHYRTGHFYMSLKDEQSIIKAVMFRNAAIRLKFMPENGMKVLCRGRVSLFERDGTYQLYIEDMQPDGAGALSVAYEQLKSKLSEEGLFNPEHKKLLPQFPKKIAVITSPTGAAVRDIFNVLSRRYPLAEILMCPVQVQGELAHEQLINAVKTVDDGNLADVIIIGRGGGSIEDLWEFNNEQLARTIFNCKIPVISAVGYETDFTICDFVSDVRAPTPSAAAELAVPDIQVLKSTVNGFSERLKKGLTKTLEYNESRLIQIMNSSYLKFPERYLEREEIHLDSLSERMLSAQKINVSNFDRIYENTSLKLCAFSPLAVLKRGYSIVRDNEKIINSKNQVSVGSDISVRLSDGLLECEVKNITEE